MNDKDDPDKFDLEHLINFTFSLIVFDQNSINFFLNVFTQVYDQTNLPTSSFSSLQHPHLRFSEHVQVIDQGQPSIVNRARRHF